ncbi:rna-directed dna polymerase from mobile element jockey-like [Limosa lapponica baueri]|uniref:Rna-directed dna polymerase from mobile element jockey-like n=1 Tax=Limosa lapponica baueri TaxID=1758121 RepID=A0A2I0T9M7_LIMLA|nr:rna-directed dna polymerase from mobile element jockey-like [Limosa lapponica baueri]
MRRGALLDFMLTNKEGLAGDVKVKGSLGCSDHEMVEFRILRGRRRGFVFYSHGTFFDKIFYKQLEEVSRSLALVLMGDFNLPDVYWKDNTAERKQSRRFLECVEDNFLAQLMLNMPTRISALLHLLLANQEDLLDNITTNVSLGYSDHNIVDFKILPSTLKTSSRTKILDFTRADFNMLRAQLQGIPWEASVEGKGACECWELFKNSFLEAQEQSIPYKGKGRRQNKRPLWLDNEILGVLKSKKAAYWLWKGSH